MEQKDHDLFTEAETAKYLKGISDRTLRQWRYLRQGPPYVKVGALIRYRKADVDRWIELHRSAHLRDH